MFICAGGIKDTTKKYKDSRVLEKEGRFMTIPEYTKFVRKTVYKFRAKYGYIAKMILESEELISEIMTEVMRADWTFNGEKSTLNTYRVNNVKWQMGDITNRIKNQYLKQERLKDRFYSHQERNEESKDIQNIIENDEKKFLISTIEKNLHILKPQEQSYIKEHYLKGVPVSEIAKSSDKSIPYVYSTMNNGIKKLKEHINVVYKI